MKRQFVCGLLSTIILGFAVWAQANSAKEPSGNAGTTQDPSKSILRLHVSGPFVICEAKDPGMNNDPALEVLVPKLDWHFPPHWYADGNDRSTFEKGTFRLMVGAHDAGPDISTAYGQLDEQAKDCGRLSKEAARELYNTIWLPLPKTVIPIAPVKVTFDHKCDDSPAGDDAVEYSTKVDLVYTDVNLSKVSVCAEKDCSWFKAKIWSVNDVGNLRLEMAQNIAEDHDDPHIVARVTHRHMRRLVGLDNHCPHFSNEDSNGDQSHSEQLHTDCHAPLLVACAPGPSVFCKGPTAKH